MLVTQNPSNASKESIDIGLRKDVRLLTTLLGDVIREQEGEKLFAKIEQIRGLAKSRHEAGTVKIVDLKKLIRSLDLDDAYKVARSFTIYFQLVNIAEEMQRVRRIRSYEREGTGLQEMSLRRLFADLKRRGHSGEELAGFMSSLSIELVLTAHPTEAKRRTVMDHLLRVASRLAELDSMDITVYEMETAKESIKETLEILWQTTELRQRRVLVSDEVDQTLFFFRRTILNLLPNMHRRLRREFTRCFPPKADPPPAGGNPRLNIKPFVRFGSWVGADRDGNPNVTCEVTKKTAALQKKLILNVYLSAIEGLIRKHSQSQEVVKASRKLAESVAEDAKIMPELAKDLERYEMSELYRQKFSFMHQKIQNMLEKKKPGTTVEDFVKDIEVIRDSLLTHKGALAAADFERLLDQVSFFGFHLAKLDFRDHAKKVKQAFREVFPNEEYNTESILKAIRSKKMGRNLSLSVQSKEFLEQLSTMRTIQEKVDRQVADDYILSMTESEEDILALFYFALQKGLIHVRPTSGGSASGGKEVKDSSIGLIPLFEVIRSLERAHEVMDRLFSIPIYRSYLRSQGNIQQVMLGYSDSAKDGGYVTANWKLYLAQKKLYEVAVKHGVKLELFHGKGGTIDRGGGESHRAILAQPYAASFGRLKITEQGEVVAQKYANPEIAERNLEQMITAVVWTNLVSKKEFESNKKIRVWEQRMEKLSALAYYRYRQLLFDTPGFLDFFNQATPIQVLKKTNIGSRPALRSPAGALVAGGLKETFEELRAIPWVFSWIQSRYIISAWYGIGFALESYISNNPQGLQELREMYEEWPFFRSILTNLQTSLAKTDISIASQYAEMVMDGELKDRIHGEIVSEHKNAIEKVLDVCSQKEILDSHRVLRDSIRQRNPYIDPLHYLQMRFLGEIREKSGTASEEDRKKIDEILLLTVNGIAFGMKSTG